MIVANIKSPADLQAKKDLQKQLIELEISNEAERQKRFQEKGIREVEGKKLVEQYRTPSEIKEDIVKLEKKALDLIIELGFNYNDAGQLVNWLSSLGRLANFNTSYKTIKKDIQEGYDKSIVDIGFLQTYLTNFFEEYDSNIGKKFSKDAEQKQITTENIFTDLPSSDDIQELMTLIEDNIVSNNKYTYLFKQKAIQIIAILRLYRDLLDFLPNFKNNPLLSQNERMKITKALYTAYDRLNYIRTEEVKLLRSELSTLMHRINLGYDVQYNLKGINLIFNRISRQLSGFANEKLRQSVLNVYKDYEKIIETKGGDYSSKISDIEEKIKQADLGYRETLKTIIDDENVQQMLEQYTEEKNEEEALSRQQDIDLYRIKKKEEKEKVEKNFEKLIEDKLSLFKENETNKNKADVADYINNLYATVSSEGSRGYRALVRLLLTRFGGDNITAEEREKLQIIYDKKVIKSEKDADFIYEQLVRTVEREVNKNPSYNPSIKQKGFQTLSVQTGANQYNKIDSGYPSEYYGLGVVSKLKKHFKGDEKLLKKVLSALQDDSSSDEEENKELARHIKATDSIDKKIDKLVKGGDAQFLPKAQRDAIYSGMKKIGLGSGKVDSNTFKFLGNKESWHDAFSGAGVGFKATRIPVSKVGKGVKLEKEDNPTYRQFGKYVLHIPHLVNNNTANFKYPSLGSIPSIKPLTVSDDYKDLILDVLQTGKLNKKELERLPQSEIKHFERVAVGAGLVEQLGLKLGSTEEDKADSKRFELLRGEYLAGNNNQDLIKELRMLITKFINTGRIHKNEGLNLLLELSTI